MSTLFDSLVRTWSRRQPKRPALEAQSHRISYEDLERLVVETASLLLSFEVEAGDRVLLSFPSSAEYVVSLLAVTAVGAVAVPVPTPVGPERLRYLVDTTRPRLCLHEASSSIDGVECHSVAVDLPAVRLESQPPVRIADLPDAHPEDAALILFSSGSTGRPKGVVLQHRHLIAAARNLSSVFCLDTEHRDLIIAPMYHSDGWQRVAVTLFAGGCVVVSPSNLFAAAGLEFLSALRISGCFLPTPVLRLLLRSAPEVMRAAMRTVRSLELGSTPITAQELRILDEQMPDARVFFHYGLTECSRATILEVRDHPEKLATVGTASPGVEIRICDRDGLPVETGQAGQILLRGPQQSTEYWNRQDLDQEKFFDGWLRTGDYGSLDTEGFLTLLGRHDDMITSAGYHFFPAEVETELGPVPGVAEYIVAGVSGQAGFLDQLLWAFVVPVDPDNWRPYDFLALARKRLPPHMMPRRVVPVAALPLTLSGKPDRAQAVQLYAHEQAR